MLTFTLENIKNLKNLHCVGGCRFSTGGGGGYLLPLGGFKNITASGLKADVLTSQTAERWRTVL